MHAEQNVPTNGHHNSLHRSRVQVNEEKETRTACLFVVLSHVAFSFSRFFSSADIQPLNTLPMKGKVPCVLFGQLWSHKSVCSILGVI